MLDRLADQRQRGKVQNAVEPAGAQGATRILGIAQVSHDQLRLGRHRLPVSALEVVKDHDLMAVLDQQARHDRADVSGAAGDEKLHIARQVRRSIESLAP